MNAALIHLASVECWQRARNIGVKHTEYVLLQIIAASTDGISMLSLLKYGGFAGSTTEHHLHRSSNSGLIIGKPSRGNRKRWHLTEAGRELMTPQARASDTAIPACDERSAA